MHRYLPCLSLSQQIKAGPLTRRELITGGGFTEPSQKALSPYQYMPMGTKQHVARRVWGRISISPAHRWFQVAPLCGKAQTLTRTDITGSRWDCQIRSDNRQQLNSRDRHRVNPRFLLQRIGNHLCSFMNIICPSVCWIAVALPALWSPGLTPTRS